MSGEGMKEERFALFKNAKFLLTDKQEIILIKLSWNSTFCCHLWR